MARSEARCFRRHCIETLYRPSVLALVCYAIYVAWLLYRHGNDATVFIYIGSYFADRPGVVSQLVHEIGFGPPYWRAGFDGQFYYYIALDPFKAWELLDTVARYQRILYPMLVRLLSFGVLPTIPYLMIAVNLAFMVAGTEFLCRFLRLFQLNPWYSIGYAFNIGLMVCLRRDLAEPIMCALVIAAIYLVETGSVKLSAHRIGVNRRLICALRFSAVKCPPDRRSYQKSSGNRGIAQSFCPKKRMRVVDNHLSSWREGHATSNTCGSNDHPKGLGWSMMALELTQIMNEPAGRVQIDFNDQGTWASTIQFPKGEVMTNRYGSAQFVMVSYGIWTGMYAIGSNPKSCWTSSDEKAVGMTGNLPVSPVVFSKITLSKMVLPEIYALVGCASVSVVLFTYGLVVYGMTSALPTLGTLTGAIVGLAAVLRLSRTGS